MALLALRSQYRLAGIVALSGYLPLRQVPPLIAPANAETPVLMCHGDADPTVSFLPNPACQHFAWRNHLQPELPLHSKDVLKHRVSAIDYCCRSASNLDR